VAENPELLTAVARLYYLEGLGQTEIASLYAVSRSTVSRMLTSARERGIVRIQVDDYDPRDRQLEEQLIERFGLRRAIVIRCLDGDDEARRRNVGFFAAADVMDWLAGTRRIGVTGGRTLGRLVRALPYRSGPGSAQVLQLMGTVAASPGQNEGSEVGRALASRLGGTFHAVNTPALVEDAQTREMFMAHEQIRSVWRMFGGVTQALVGVGSVEDSMFVDHNVLSRGLRCQLRERGAVAEVCGRYVDRAGNEIDLHVRDRVIGAELTTLRRIGEVIAVTSGEGRGEAVRAVLGGRLATSIVTDDACARAVLQRDMASMGRRNLAGF
jgi:deoxyribonucleoside regulator